MDKFSGPVNDLKSLNNQPYSNSINRYVWWHVLSHYFTFCSSRIGLKRDLHCLVLVDASFWQLLILGLLWHAVIVTPWHVKLTPGAGVVVYSGNLKPRRTSVAFLIVMCINLCSSGLSLTHCHCLMLVNASFWQLLILGLLWHAVIVTPWHVKLTPGAAVGVYSGNLKPWRTSIVFSIVMCINLCFPGLSLKIPRTYKRAEGARKYGYSAESRQQAVVGVKQDCMSIKQAALLHSVNRTTFLNHLKKYCSGSVGWLTLLTGAHTFGADTKCMCTYIWCDNSLFGATNFHW